MKSEILRMEHVTLEERGEQVLDNINIYIVKGEIFGLLVSDYKGKEQLIQLLLNNIPISFGRIYFDEKLVNTYEHSNYSFNKVYFIGQRSGLVPDLTVADNIFVMRSSFKKHIISRNVLRQQTLRLFEKLEVLVDPDSPAVKLSALNRCIVEIVKAQIAGCRLIILCDLRNFLSRMELERFHEIVRLYQEEGYSFFYIGNHHEELFKICDRTALLSKGRICKVFGRDEMDDAHIQPYTISFDISSSKIKKPKKNSILCFRNIHTKHMKNVTFFVRQGECLLVLDLNNTVLCDIIEIMTKGRETYQGRVFFEDQVYNPQMSMKSLENGIAVISENPVTKDLFFNMTYLDNLIFLLDLKLKKSNISRKYIRSVIREFEPKVGSSIYASDIKGLDSAQLYNLVYYRILLYHPKTVFCINPFAWGDMLCRRHVLELIQELKNSGITVVILSVTISDALDVADRLLIIQEGEIVGEYTERDFERFQGQK